ncbi:MAG: nucleoside deaminase [Oscillospiraceae bacterium]|jgi:tRNA(adenine34) deaminase|nr:nucleoside deaminase [Oscillospiraceae bacterium]
MDTVFMRRALELAARAAALGEVPVGCVIVKGGVIAGEGFNCRESGKNALLHAELTAIAAACAALEGWRLCGCDMYVTLEPCAMCAGAAVNARIDGIVFAASDPKAGALGGRFDLLAHGLNHTPRVTGGVLAAEASALLTGFFRSLRGEKESVSE